MNNEALAEEAKKYIKSHVDDLIEKFADTKKHPPVERPFSIFMAGSPGAGKTEFSKTLIKLLRGRGAAPIVRIDADEIRKIIPHYDGSDAHLLQGAAAIGVEKLFDHVQQSGQNAILDATFANYDKSRENVKRALGRKRGVVIVYLYQRPEVAWAVTKKRGVLEGRIVPREVFIDSFLNVRENVEKVKNEFGKDIILMVALKDVEFKTAKLYFDVAEVDKYLPRVYNREEVEKIVAEIDKLAEA